MRSTANEIPSILLDFGTELQGGIQLTTGVSSAGGPVTVRIRFGESVSEAMAELGGKTNATNDHAIRDFTIKVPWIGSIEVGNSGFRFVRIDLVEPNKELFLKDARAVFTYRDIPYVGSFRSNDERLNKIWETGAYTVHLNMQDFLLEGIKRDRLIWQGDLYPEVKCIMAVFGNNEVVPKSLDHGRETTPLPAWMSGYSAYSLWWIINQHDWYLQNGDLSYLQKQRKYLVELLNNIIGKISADGTEQLDGARFLDWPTSRNPEVIHSGLQALMAITMDAGEKLCIALGEKETAQKCSDAAKRLRQQNPMHTTPNKQQPFYRLPGCKIRGQWVISLQKTERKDSPLFTATLCSKAWQKPAITKKRSIVYGNIGVECSTSVQQPFGKTST